jgi:hypothetical protein
MYNFKEKLEDIFINITSICVSLICNASVDVNMIHNNE